MGIRTKFYLNIYMMHTAPFHMDERVPAITLCRPNITIGPTPGAATRRHPRRPAGLIDSRSDTLDIFEAAACVPGSVCVCVCVGVYVLFNRT